MVNIDEILAALYATQEEAARLRAECDTTRNELAQANRKLRWCGNESNELTARLDAVLGHCNHWDRNKNAYNWSLDDFVDQVRAAATGDTK